MLTRRKKRFSPLMIITVLLILSWHCLVYAQGPAADRQKNIFKDIAAYTKASELNPDSAGTFHALGRLYAAASTEIPEEADLWNARADKAFSTALDIAEGREKMLIARYYEDLYANDERKPPLESVRVDIRERLLDEARDENAMQAIETVWILKLELANHWLRIGQREMAENALLAVESFFSEKYPAQRMKDGIYNGSERIKSMYLKAQDLGLSTALGVRYKLAEQYDELGNKAKAVQLIGVKGYASLRADRSRELENNAKDMIMKDDFKSAQSFLRQALSLSPDTVDVNLYNYLALISDKFKNYAESAWARKKYITMTGEKKVEVTQWRALAYTQAVMGDYKAAFEAVQQGLEYFPADDGLIKWGAVYACGVGGWDAAAKFWQRRYPGQSNEDMRNEIYYGGWKLGEKAEDSNNRYAALRHYSMAFSVILADDYKYSPKKETTKKIIEIYNKLPIKPLPPQTAVANAVKAEEYIHQKDLDRGNIALYNAISAAPWWPEAYYNRALILGEMRHTAEAVRTMGVFLRLAPGHANADKARQKIADWQKILAIGRIEVSPDIEAW